MNDLLSKKWGEGHFSDKIMLFYKKFIVVPNILSMIVVPTLIGHRFITNVIPFSHLFVKNLPVKKTGRY